MNSGTVSGRHYATGQPIGVTWQDGIVSRVELLPAGQGSDLWIAPALVDLQINGYATVDFQRDDLTAVELMAAVQGLRTAGCGRFLLTLMTDDWGAMMRRLRHLRALRGTSRDLTKAIAGWHLEGPFLSDKPGFCGAHPVECMTNATREHLEELRSVTDSDPVLLTLAPERMGGIEAVGMATSMGMRVSLGHTNAAAAILRAACNAGATGFTHLGNACPQDLDRHDNILWRVLDDLSLTISLIPDGIHVSAALFRLIHRVLPPSKIYYTTDAVAAAGAPPGRYSVGRHRVDVGPDRVVRQPGKTNYAGSGLRPIEGIWRAAEMLGRPWQSVWDFASVHPAGFMGWGSGVGVEQSATFCLVRSDEGTAPELVETIVEGSPSSRRAVDFHAD